MSAASFRDPLKSKGANVGDASTHRVSKTRRSFVGTVIALLAAGILLLTLGGCGGGTRGTGDQLKSLVVGTVVDTSGAPLSSATITQLETGDSTVTDGSGAFALEVAVEGGSARLLIESGGFEGTATLSGLGEGSGGGPVEFTITVDLISGIVTEVTVNDTTPQPTPEPTAGPNPEPTRNPDNGSSEREYLFTGTVVDQRGERLAGVRLSVAGSGSVVSSSSGRFSITVKTSETKVQFSVGFNSSRGGFTIRNLPQSRDARINLTVHVTQRNIPTFEGGETFDPNLGVALSNVTIR